MGKAEKWSWHSKGCVQLVVGYDNPKNIFNICGPIGGKL
jgi:hypothetical protein